FIRSITIAVFGAFLAVTSSASAQDDNAGGPGAKLTGSRTRYTHRITLYDERDVAIAAPKPDAKPDPTTPPFSTMKTCGKCHEVNAIEHGWHFNAADPKVPHGRN